MTDILEDVKLYQDAAIEYRNAYEKLETKICGASACLMEEASRALLAVAETQASQETAGIT